MSYNKPIPPSVSDWKQDFIRRGQGPALLLLHGWPLHNLTFRKLLPLLESHFTCYLPNALGMNAAGVPKGADFSFAAHAARVLEFADSQGLSQFALLGQDTGGTIARLVAASAPQRVTHLVLLNTEIPGHRPPFIPLFQKSSYLPGNRQIFSKLLGSHKFLKSKMRFGGSFYDLANINAEFIELFATHWTQSKTRYQGLMSYLQGIDFGVVDNLTAIHAQIETPTQFIWGQDDVTFPVGLARNMAHQIPGLKGFNAIERSAFLLHEERPDAVAKVLLEFVSCR